MYVGGGGEKRADLIGVRADRGRREEKRERVGMFFLSTMILGLFCFFFSSLSRPLLCCFLLLGCVREETWKESQATQAAE